MDFLDGLGFYSFWKGGRLWIYCCHLTREVAVSQNKKRGHPGHFWYPSCPRILDQRSVPTEGTLWVKEPVELFNRKGKNHSWAEINWCFPEASQMVGEGGSGIGGGIYADSWLKGGCMQLPDWRECVHRYLIGHKKPGNDSALGMFRKKTFSEHIKPVTSGRKEDSAMWLIARRLGQSDLSAFLTRLKAAPH